MSQPTIGGWSRIFKGKSLYQVIKQGWHDNPEIVGSLGLAGLGILGWAYIVQQNEKKGEDRFIYKKRYIVVRDTDLKNPESDRYS